jgi:hypothetical protein
VSFSPATSPLVHQVVILLSLVTTPTVVMGRSREICCVDAEIGSFFERFLDFWPHFRPFFERLHAIFDRQSEATSLYKAKMKTKSAQKQAPPRSPSPLLLRIPRRAKNKSSTRSPRRTHGGHGEDEERGATFRAFFSGLSVKPQRTLCWSLVAATEFAEPGEGHGEIGPL